MDYIIEFLRTDNFLVILSIISILLLIGFIVMIVRLNKINKRYKQFLDKLGNGQNIEEDLENYMYRVERVEKQNAEISNYVKNLDQDLT